MFLRNSIVSLLFVILLAGSAHASIDSYIDNLNIYASKHFNDFKVDLSTRFGISSSRFDKIMRRVDSPGDLAVCLWVGLKTHQSLDEVVRQYRVYRNKGWIVIAQELGLNPGSNNFNILKNGLIDWKPRNFDEVIKEHRKERAMKRKKEYREKQGR